MAKTIAILSGKGGVGKTFLATALGASLFTEFRKRVLLVDGNFTSPGIGVFLNIVRPPFTIYEAIEGTIEPAKAVFVHDTGIHVLPAPLSVGKEIDYSKLAGIVNSLSASYDYILIDGPGGIGNPETSIAAAADSTIIVATPDLPSATGALKLIGTLQSQGRAIEGIVLNRCRGKSEKHELSTEEIEKSSRQRVLSSIPEDHNVYESAFSRTPLTLYSQNSPSSLAVRGLAADFSGVPKPQAQGIFSSLFQKKGDSTPQKKAESPLSAHMEGIRASVVGPSSQPGQPGQPAQMPQQVQQVQQPQQSPPTSPTPSLSKTSQEPAERKTPQMKKDELTKSWMEGKITLDEMMSRMKKIESED